MMIGAKTDLAALQRLIDHMIRYAESEAIREDAMILVHDIKLKSRIGVDASNQRFPEWTDKETGERNKTGSPYSPSQDRRRRKAGVTPNTKTLSVTERMLRSLGLNGKWVTVSDEFERIAHGQMFHRKWRYHHLFLLAGRDTIESITEHNARRIIRI